MERNIDRDTLQDLIDWAKTQTNAMQWRIESIIKQYKKDAAKKEK